MDTPVHPNSVETAPSENTEVLAAAEIAQPAESEQPVKLFTPEEVQELLDQNGPKVMVVFDYIRNDATKGTDRIFLNRARDILTTQDVLNVEKQLVDQSNGTLARVLITNWKPLQA